MPVLLIIACILHGGVVVLMMALSGFYPSVSDGKMSQFRKALGSAFGFVILNSFLKAIQKYAVEICSLNCRVNVGQRISQDVKLLTESYAQFFNKVVVLLPFIIIFFTRGVWAGCWAGWFPLPSSLISSWVPDLLLPG